MRIVRLSQRALGGVVLALTFLAGAAAGVVVLKVWPGPDQRVTLRTNSMSPVLDQLGLTPAQRRSADSILEHSAPQSEALMVELARRMSGVADSVDAQLRAILTPQQRRQLDALQRKPVFLLKRRSTTGPDVVDTVYSGARGGRR